MPRLLLATNNPGKVREFRALLGDCGWELVTPGEVGISLGVAETGATYAENARIKARAFAEASGLPALADDSGLEVDALGGEPGPLHHAKGWDGANDAERIELLLSHLASVPSEQRTARFRIVLSLALARVESIEVEGTCEGLIGMEPVGTGGFGYDPVFFLPERRKTMAELSFQEKNEVSHRARAARALCPQLQALASRSV